MKKLFLLVTGLLGLCTLGAHAAKADSYDGYNRGDNCDYRRSYYRETYRDDCDYQPRRRLVIVHEYERPYRYDDYYPRYRHHRHVDVYLPVPPLPPRF